MPIPLAGAVEPNVNIIGRFHQSIGQTRSTAGTKDGIGFLEGRKNLLVPPTGVTKLHDITAAGIKLLQDALESGRSEMIAGRQLKEETSHPWAEQIGNQTEIANERL